MARTNPAVLGLALAGVLFVIAALIPLIRGSEFNAALLVPAIAFFLVALVVHKKSLSGSVPPAN